MTRAALLAGLVCAYLVTACRSPGGETDGSSEGEFCARALARVDSFMGTVRRTSGPGFGGTAVVGGLGDLSDGMNSLASQDYASQQHQQFVNLMTLVALDAEYGPVPYLAESWELSAGGAELTFRLRPDVLWHDGVPTTARDVEFTYLRAKDPATGFPGSSALEYYEGVQVVDSFTVRFRLRPHSGALEPWRTLAILPAHLLGRVPPERLRAHPFGKLCPVGNGPFRFVEHRAGESWSFEANPAFPPGLGGRPKLDGYVYRVIPEQTTLLAELLSGGIDLYVKVPPSQATAVEEAAGVRLLVFPFREFVFVGWNSRRPQLADARVRRAMTLATNRRQIVDALLGGHGRVANTGVPPFHWAFDPALADSLAYDPGRARALLEEAGWVDRDGDGVREDRDGTPLSLTIRVNQGNRTRSDIAEIMQAELQRIGVELRPLSLEWGTFIQGLTDPAARDFDAFVLSFVADFQVDETDLFRSDRIDGPLAFSGTRNEALDSLLRRLPLTEDRVEARRMWREYQRLIVEEQPYTYLFFEDRLDGVAERLRNVRMDARGDWVGISSWEIPTDRRRHRSADGG